MKNFHKSSWIGFGILKALDVFRGKIDAVRPSDCVRLQREILKGIDICKLLHDGSMVGLDDTFEISDKTASVVEFDRYLVIANIFRINHMKHSLDQWIDFFVFLFDIGKDHRGRVCAAVQHIAVAFLEFRIEAFFRPCGGIFNLVHIIQHTYLPAQMQDFFHDKINLLTMG